MSPAVNVDDGLSVLVEKLWEASLSKNTKQVYKTGINCFVNFLKMNRFIDFHMEFSHIAEDHFILFVTYCKYVLNLKFDTIKLYLAGVRHFFIRYQKQDPFEKSVRLDYIMRGIKKLQVNTTSKRFPITSNVLLVMCNKLKEGIFSPFIDVMLLCIFKMAFFGFLRCGEFTYSNTSESFLKIENIDIVQADKHYTVLLQSSKCDTFHKGVKIDIFENNSLQPVDSMVKYIEKRMRQGASSSSPLFIENEFNVRPLSRITFIRLLKEVLLRSGFNDSLFSGHSFRIGAATSAAAAGVEDHIIKSLGRWNSDCYMRYIKIDKDTLIMAQQDMCVGNYL